VVDLITHVPLGTVIIPVTWTLSEHLLLSSTWNALSRSRHERDIHNPVHERSSRSRPVFSLLSTTSDLFSTKENRIKRG